MTCKRSVTAACITANCCTDAAAAAFSSSASSALQSSPVAPQPACRTARRRAASSGPEQGDGDKPEEKVSFCCARVTRFGHARSALGGAAAATATFTQHGINSRRCSKAEQSAPCDSRGSKTAAPRRSNRRVWRILQQRSVLCRIAKRKHQQPHTQQQQSVARRTCSELEGESRERRGRQVGSSSDALQGEEEPQSVGTEVR